MWVNCGWLKLTKAPLRIWRFNRRRCETARISEGSTGLVPFLRLFLFCACSLFALVPCACSLSLLVPFLRLFPKLRLFPLRLYPALVPRCFFPALVPFRYLFLFCACSLNCTCSLCACSLSSLVP